MESSEEAMEKVQKQHSLNEQLKELHSKLDYTIQARIPQTDLMAMGKYITNLLCDRIW